MKRIAIISILVLIFLVFQGCGKDNASSTDVATIAPTGVIESPEVSNTPMASDVPDMGATLLTEKIAQAPILKNGLKIEEIAKFLNLSEDDLIKKHENSIENVRYTFDYTEYLYNTLDISIVCYSSSSGLHKDDIVKSIELDKNKVSFNGITSDMNFVQVMKILGDTEINTLEEGLPGLFTYELRYQYNGINLMIYSWDKKGDSGLHFSIVDEFSRKYRYIRITPEQIGHYFEMTREELKQEIGEGIDQAGFNYSQYGADFWYDEQGSKLYSIRLASNYQINDLNQGIKMEEVMKIMGKRKIAEYQTSEDGPYYTIEYDYKNFKLQVVYFPSQGWRAECYILGKEYSLFPYSDNFK